MMNARKQTTPGEQIQSGRRVTTRDVHTAPSVAIMIPVDSNPMRGVL